VFVNRIADWWPLGSHAVSARDGKHVGRLQRLSRADACGNPGVPDTALIKQGGLSFFSSNLNAN